jgi:hypothetical protein
MVDNLAGQTVKIPRFAALPGAKAFGLNTVHALKR